MDPRSRPGIGQGRRGHGPPASADAASCAEQAAGSVRGRGGPGPVRPPPVAARGVSAEAAYGGFLATAAAAVESFFLDSTAPEPAAEGTGPVEMRPVVCVFGLARRCGVTVVARALAAELAL